MIFNTTEAEKLCFSLISGEVPQEEIEYYLISLQQKGETVEDILGFVKTILKFSNKVPFSGETIDVCGTGGSNLSRYNTSTTVAFILACFNLKIAKHGNRGSKERNGSFDFLEDLGININLNVEQYAELLEKTNLAFLYAPTIHPLLKNVSTARKNIQGRTIFNLVGPFCNPTNVKTQLLGTPSFHLQQILSSVGKQLGRTNLTVVCGHPFIDEVSISGDTTVISDRKGSSNYFKWNPSMIGIPEISYDSLPTGLSNNNVDTFKHLINNKPLVGIADMVYINAAFALYTEGVFDTINEAFVEVKKVVELGKVRQKYEEYKRQSFKV